MIGTAPTRIDIKPQPGPQTRFLQSTADITIYGGAAGGGKTFGTLLFPLRHTTVQPTNDFQAVIFRRTYKRITQAGGLEDESRKLYSMLGGSYNNTDMQWTFNREGCHSTIQFAHLQHEKDKEGWKGAQIPLICFEELTEFPEDVFFYLQSRNRSTCGVKPQTIATTNPDADSWVKRFLAPWVDENWPAEDRAVSGETRYFLRDGNAIHWLPRGEVHEDATSVKFIFASIYDNPILLAKDPNYIKRLKSLPLVERLRLLNGDWSIRPEGGTLFRREWFRVVDVAPAQSEWMAVARAWDFAATEDKPKQRGDGPDYTATVKVARLKDGRFVVLDARKMREKPHGVETALKNLAQQDGQRCIIALEQEPGSAGVTVKDYFTRQMAGYIVKVAKPSRSKIERARPASSQVEAGNVLVVRGPQTEEFLNDLESFPNPHVHDDFPDAFGLAMSQFYTTLTAEDSLQEVRERLALREARQKEVENAAVLL